MNVQYHCKRCNHTANAPANTEPPCQINLGDACEMRQMEEFPAVTPKKASAVTKKVAHDS